MANLRFGVLIAIGPWLGIKDSALLGPDPNTYFSEIFAWLDLTPGSPSQVWRRIAKLLNSAEIRWALGPRGFKSHSRRQLQHTLDLVSGFVPFCRVLFGIEYE